MHASMLVSILACCGLGCGGAIQPGLANAAALGGATPETRVHDAVANGRDSCERAMYPQGGVLRGQIPPCSRESLPTPVAFAPTPAIAEPSLSVPYPIEFCLAVRRSLTSGLEKSATAFPLYTTPWWPACDSHGGI